MIIQEINSTECNSINDSGYGSIVEAIRELSNQSPYKRVIFIVIGGLSAGYRLNNKELIRYIRENRGTDASTLQGFNGRACGYHENSPVMITPMIFVDEYLRYCDCLRKKKEYTPTHKVSTQFKVKKVKDSVFIPAKIFDITDKVLSAFPTPNLSPGGYQKLEKVANNVIDSLGYDSTNKSNMFSVGHSEEFVDGKWVHRERVNFKEVWPQVQSGKLNYAGVGWYQGEQKPQTLLWYYLSLIHI